MLRQASPLRRHAHVRLLNLPRLVFVAAALIAVGCGGSSASPKNPGSSGGRVLERAEGFDDRPGWADPNVPFSRRDGMVRVLGYVAIGADQRKEAGFRAADSYARAELVRFLSTRIVAVLTDKVSTQEAGKISEAISETAHLLIEDISITAHYWEKVETKDGEKVRLYSRIDVDRERVQELLAGVWEKKGDLRTPLGDVQLAVVEGWDKLEAVEGAASSADLLPKGVYTPDWAKKGDVEDAQAFHFVCHGLAADEDHAGALARRMCTEKLCRLFGVQIKSQTTVREDLEGIDVQSEVSEGCLDVRLEDRTTEYNGGECGPRGCVKWIMQRYPKSSYVAERARLDNPTVVERQVVVQEGDIKYKDPAACEAELRKYGEVQDRTYEDIKKRREILQRALGACQGIDGRDSGLYSRLTHLLESPLPSFTTSSRGYQERPEDHFLYVDAKWLEQLKTERFFDQRISMVVRLLKDAEPPVFAYHTMKTKPQDLAAIQKATQPLYAYPYEDKPALRTHSTSVHRVHHYRPKGQRDPQYLEFLLKEARARSYACEWASWLSGSILITDLINHGRGTEAEWQAGLHVLKNASSSPYTCARYLLKGQPKGAKRMARAREILRLVKAGTVSFSDFSNRRETSQVTSLTNFISGDFTVDEQLELISEFLPQFSGTREERLRLAKRTLEDADPKYNERGPTQCENYVRTAESLTSMIPEFGFGEYQENTMCECLESGFTGSARARVIQGLSTTANRTCKHVKDDEWPGGMEPRPDPPKPPANVITPKPRSRGEKTPPGTPANPWDIASLISPAIKGCLMNTDVRQPYNGVLNAYVEITASASSQGASNVVPNVVLRTTPRDVSFRDRKGWVTLSDLRKSKRAIEVCIKSATEAARPAADSPLEGTSRSKVWLLFSSADVYKAFLLP